MHCDYQWMAVFLIRLSTFENVASLLHILNIFFLYCGQINFQEWMESYHQKNCMDKHLL